MSNQPLHPLTSLRFLAVGAVLLCHRPRVDNNTDWLPYERHAAASVTFFFLLSGFVLAYTYRSRLVPWAPRTSWNFLVARFARLWPVYLLAFLLSLWISAETPKLLSHKPGSAGWRALALLTMTQSLIPRVEWFFAYNPPAWSLSAEWMFYLLFPLLLNGLVTGSLARRIGVFLAASAWWATACAVYFTTPGEPLATRPWLMWLVYVCPFARVFDFTCGVVLGLLFVRGRPAVGPVQGARFWLWGLVELSALAFLWAGLHFCPVSPGVGGNPWPALPMLSAQGYYLPFFAVIVWVAALGRGPLSRAASARIPVYLGEISYGVYIFHFPVIALWGKYFQPAGWSPEWRVLMTVVFAAATAVAVSAASYQLYELPLRGWLRRKLSWDAPSAAAEEVVVLPWPRQQLPLGAPPVAPEVVAPPALRKAA